MSKAGSSPLNLVVAPFETIFLARREEIMKLVHVTSYALQHMEGSARLASILKRSEENVDFLKGVESSALQEASSDFPMLNASATVLLWGALEASIRDFLANWLLANDSARQVEELRRIKVPLADYERLGGEERMKYVVGLMERELGAALKPGIGRFECLLKPFNLSPLKDDDGVPKALNEMAAVRNVIVHRAARVDKRFKELCPSFDLAIGATIRVSTSMLSRYVWAASEYTASIIDKAESIGIDGQGAEPKP